MKFLIMSVFLLLQAPASAPAPTIVQINLDDVVHPVSADYIKDGLNHAKTSKHARSCFGWTRQAASSIQCATLLKRFLRHQFL